MRGERAFSVDVAASIASERVAPGGSALDDLGPRETEILRLVPSGWTTAEIADAMSISPKTVQNYHYGVKAKLGLRTDAEMVRLAMRVGLVGSEAI